MSLIYDIVSVGDLSRMYKVRKAVFFASGTALVSDMILVKGFGLPTESVTNKILLFIIIAGFALGSFLSAILHPDSDRAIDLRKQELNDRKSRSTSVGK